MKVPKLSIDEISVINSTLDQVKIHPQYNKSIEDAVSSDLEISLNYHTHPDEASYCVSILSEKIDLLTLTEKKKSFVELAHIRGIGKAEEDQRKTIGHRETIRDNRETMGKTHLGKP